MVSIPTESNIQLNEDYDLSNKNIAILKMITQSIGNDYDNLNGCNASNVEKPKTLGDVLKHGDQMSADETSSNASTEGMEHGDCMDNQTNGYSDKDGGHKSNSNSPHSGEGNGGNDNCKDGNSSNNWGRAPGRKKTHPVWIFFKDLKDSGLDDGGIICLHCDWKGTDKSPNNLKIHLKKFHADDGIYDKYCQALANTPTQPYAKRKRANDGYEQPNTTSKICNLNNKINNSSLIPLDLFTSLTGNNQINKTPNIDISSDAFTVAYKMKTENEDPFKKQLNESSQNGMDLSALINIANTEKKQESNGLNDALKLAGLGSFILNSAAMSQNTNSVTPNILAQISNNTQNNTLSNFFNKNVNITPKKDMSPTTSGNSSFALADENCFQNLLSIAKDMNISMTYSFNNQHEFTFTKKDLNNKPDFNGKSIILKDYPCEIKMYERNQNDVTECEAFKKADWPQMHWALRGKIQNLLFR
uniref:BED-type domain-containing protein n=1 Tax=Parastrongyloides trichosuri TaxID=131310 RepID=A0A0N4Z926_PARTI